MAANLNVNQVATSVTSAEAVAARGSRLKVTVKNIDTAITIYVGVGTVTSTNSLPLLAGESYTFETEAAINALAASSTPRLAFVEVW